MEPVQLFLRSLRQDWRNWILVLPGAALSVFVAKYTVQWLFQISASLNAGRDEDGKLICEFPFALMPPDLLEYFAMAFLAPALMIGVGARLAPKFKFEVGIFMAVLFGLFLGYGLQYIVSDVEEGLYNTGRWLRLDITVGLWASGVVFGLRSAKKQHQESINAGWCFVNDASLKLTPGAQTRFRRLSEDTALTTPPKSAPCP
jgi:hypothetical protein